ncbi:MAG: hypothetical protein IJ716_12565 [Lachnospiraceae bacterium]|nr:hypothetical protein [Lachnospiraceae bacterium]
MKQDEELWKLIQELESGELLRAPSYLKREILDALPEEQPETRLETQRAGKSRFRRNLEWFGYALEVGAVTAAAVALVLLVPVQEERGGIEPDEVYAVRSAQEEERWEREAEARQQISDAASDLTKKIVTWGSFLLPDEEEDIR